MREKTRMYMPGIYVDHLSNRIRDMFESNRITSQGFLLGTVLPGVVIIVMAIIWIAGGNPIAFEHARHLR